LPIPTVGAGLPAIAMGLLQMGG
ncbi:hypothetical protein GIW29_30290, partial [Pseudomonas sp. PA-5-4B]|nr:hypothetical protein [Pseudomonas sp. PA-5-4B]